MPGRVFISRQYRLPSASRIKSARLYTFSFNAWSETATADDAEIAAAGRIIQNQQKSTQAKPAVQDAPLLTVSSSPHIRDGETVTHIMWQVNLALAPAALFAVYHFGLPALVNMAVGIVSAIAAEYVWQRAMRQPVTAFDGSACITGLLLAMSMSPLLPPWMVAIGSALAIIVAKQSMGGLGFNIFNPAHIGRAALMVSWPVAMTTWTTLSGTASVDAVATATPLNVLKMQGYDAVISLFGGQGAMYQAMFLGNRNGSLGETSTVLLLAGDLVFALAGLSLAWWLRYDTRIGQFGIPVEPQGHAVVEADADGTIRQHAVGQAGYPVGIEPGTLGQQKTLEELEEAYEN